ncbi:hypothetical protein M405DRAFT_852180 [Rhizopogon salebrosus TDB-379]|nr:hypothetical protein M405DRAFT_852180 [Rhizopogon salebrosus TDB-379]
MTLPLRPRLRLDFGAFPPPSNFVQATGHDDSRLQFTYSHVSNFRSLLLDMQLYSPSVKMVKQPMLDGMISCPVFGDHDRVEGKITLDPSCSQSGRLTISIEGVFEYVSVNEDPDDDYAVPKISKHQNIFLSSSVVIPISPFPDSRSAFGVRKRLGHSNFNSPASRSCDFSFEIPRGSRPGEEMPPTFSSSMLDAKGRGSLSFVEKAETSYRVTAVWESSNMSENRGILEVPILFHPDTDFQSMDGSKVEPELWLEMPLIPERPIPFHCAVTLPRPRTFSRSTYVPYFVVFTSTPRCSVLTAEIAADATVGVSLIRKITINPQLPHTPLDNSDDSDGSSNSFAYPRTKLLKRAPMPAAVRAPKTPEEPFSATVRYKPLPELPQASFLETRTLNTQVHIGFPKRPRRVNHLKNQAHTPDGLYKGEIHLPKDMLPGVDWPGVSVKYYLDVTVLFRQDVVRACVPIQVL